MTKKNCLCQKALATDFEDEGEEKIGAFSLQGLV